TFPTRKLCADTPVNRSPTRSVRPNYARGGVRVTCDRTWWSRSSTIPPHWNRPWNVSFRTRRCSPWPPGAPDTEPPELFLAYRRRSGGSDPTPPWVSETGRDFPCRLTDHGNQGAQDRTSTRLNSSHVSI